MNTGGSWTVPPSIAVNQMNAAYTGWNHLMTMEELRCGSKLHGLLIIDSQVIEVKCNSRFCGASRDVVVLHRFAITTGELIETRTFRDPQRGTR